MSAETEAGGRSDFARFAGFVETAFADRMLACGYAPSEAPEEVRLRSVCVRSFGETAFADRMLACGYVAERSEAT